MDSGHGVLSRDEVMGGVPTDKTLQTSDPTNRSKRLAHLAS